MDIGQITGFFGWMAIVNSILLSLSIMLVLSVKDYMCKLHGKWFGLEKQQICMAAYCFCGLYKILIFVFNIVPYAALKIICS